MKKTILGFLSLCLSITCVCEEIEPYKQGPIHEAYMNQEYGETIVEAVPIAPPQIIDEQMPENQRKNLMWLSGYWAWSWRKSEFVWVSGIFRNPPPGHQWIPGKWKKYEAGWVWLTGFWSPINLENFKSISTLPPDEIDEKIPLPPNGDYSWIPGYWQYNYENKHYIWYSGRWEAFDRNWVYTPPHYIWRPSGYLFIPAYWDWPLEKRGIAYSSVLIEPQYRENITYTPDKILDPLYVVELYYPYYPYYLSFYQYHYHYHKEFWIAWRYAPPWWAWETWWCFTWFDQYWLWWWWSHPGYPHPAWLSSFEAKKILPPPKSLVGLLKGMVPPDIVTPNGVVGPERLIRAGRKIQAIGKNPILPSDPKQLEDIQIVALPKPLPPVLKPTGQEALGDKGLQKPSFGPSVTDLGTPPHRVQVPPKPQKTMLRNSDKNQITPRPRPPSRPQNGQTSYPRRLYPSNPVQSNYSTYQRKTNGPSYRPENQPSYAPSPSYTPPGQQETQSRQQEEQFGPHMEEPPQQGVDPHKYQEQPLPFSQQDKGNFMQQPMPQKNPAPSQQYPKGLYDQHTPMPHHQEGQQPEAYQ